MAIKKEDALTIIAGAMGIDIETFTADNKRFQLHKIAPVYAKIGRGELPASTSYDPTWLNSRTADDILRDVDIEEEIVYVAPRVPRSLLLLRSK